MPTTTRVFNFSAGPAVLPVPVLEQAQRDLVALPGVGMSVMEISHRSKTFEDLLHGAIAGHPRAGGRAGELPSPVAAGRREPAVLDGADEPAHAGATADYVDTGTWADKAIEEAKRVGTVNVTGSTKADNYNRIPAQPELHADARRRLRAHHDQQHDRRHGVEGRCPTSAMCRSSPTPRPTSSAARSTSRRFGLIYAGAQKNLGPSGVTLVIIREDLLARSHDEPADDAELQGAGGEQLALQHAEHVRHLHPRPDDEVAEVARRACRRSRAIEPAQGGEAVREIDRTGFYRGTAQKESRSLMNVTFRLPSEELEKTFDKAGHRSGTRRPQRAPLGRRHARVDLQRVSGRRRGRARRVHARVRAHARARRVVAGLRRSRRRRRRRRRGGARRLCGAFLLASLVTPAASMNPRQCSTTSGAWP